MVLEKDSFMADDFETSYASAQQGSAEAQSALALCYYEGEGTEQNPEEAVSWWQKAAAQHYPEAQYWLGNCFYYGQGVTKDTNTAIKYWIQASEQGNIEAKYNLGICYLYGNGVPQNTAQALSLWTTAAEAGDVEAQLSLGKLYAKGLNGVSRNTKKAFSYYKQAGEQGNAEASFWVAQYLRDENYLESCSWLRKAAEAGLAEAQFELGVLLTSQGETSSQPDEYLLEVIHWWRLAAEQDNANALYALSLTASMDNLSPDAHLSQKEGLEFCKRAAAKGHREARLQLAVGLLDGLYGIKENKKKGLEAIRVLAEEEHYPSAIYQLGICYMNGNGCKKKLSKSFECFTEAAKHGYVMAKLQLGFCYELGLGTKIDIEKAIENYAVAAEAEEEDALFHLALCYMTGLGVPKDLKKAKKMLQEAAELSQDNAALLLENWKKVCTLDTKIAILTWLDHANNHSKELSPLDQEALEAERYIRGTADHEGDPKKGIAMLKKAEKKGSAVAARTLGLLYLEGKYITQDFKKASDLLMQASEKGDIRAQIELAWMAIIYLEEQAFFESAIHSLTEFHNLGHIQASYYLGYCYLTGSGVKQDYKKAISLLTKVKDDFPKAEYFLAAIYKEGLGVTPNPQKAFAFTQSAYTKGDKEAISLLASFYEEGLGTEKDLVKARALYEECLLATPSNHHVQHVLGYMCFAGEGGPVDHARAIQLWEEAAKAGLPASQNALGQCYLQGLAGLEVNRSRAIKLLKKAAAQKEPHAIQALKELKKKK